MKIIISGFLFISFFLVSSSVHSERIELNTYFHENAPPRYFIDEGIDTGICIDIIEALNKELVSENFLISNKELKRAPARRIAFYLENDTVVDIYVGSAKTQRRIDAGAQYSIPLYPLNITFAKHRENDFVYNNETSLNGLKISVLAGGRSAQTLKDIEGITIQETGSFEESLQLLSLKRVDLVMYHDLGLAWQIKNFDFSEQLEILPNDQYLRAYDHYIMFRESTPQSTIDKVNKAIKAIQADGTVDRILAKYR